MTGLRLAPDKSNGAASLSGDRGNGGSGAGGVNGGVGGGGEPSPSENWSTISLNSSAHTTPASYKKGKRT